MESYKHASDILAAHGNEYNGSFLLNRMVFSHQVTALEAYLGDTLINGVMNDEYAMQCLVKNNKDLEKVKFTLAEILENPDLVKCEVREYLRSILYHNLAKVGILYKSVFNIQILNETTNKKSLFKAVKLRHDCVHRNGFDKDGRELQDFTKQYVQDTADQIRGFVENIEMAVRLRLPGEVSSNKPSARP